VAVLAGVRERGGLVLVRFFFQNRKRCRTWSRALGPSLCPCKGSRLHLSLSLFLSLV
jgi:hypothetical protein